MVRLVGGEDGSICCKRVVDAGVGHQVGLELGQIHVQRPVKAEGGSDGGEDLGDDPVEVGVGRTVDVQILPSDVVNCLS